VNAQWTPGRSGCDSALLTAGCPSIEYVQFFAGLETDGFTGGDADLSTRARVAADTGLTWPNAEHAKATELNAITSGEGLLEAFKNSIDSRLSLGSRQACPLDDVVDDILLDQSVTPWCLELLACSQRSAGQMLL